MPLITSRPFLISPVWDTSNPSYSGVSLDVSLQSTTSSSVQIKPDGTELYVAGRADSDIHQYTLSTPFDLNSGSFTGTFDTSSQDTIPRGVFLKPDGTKMYVSGDQNWSVYEYNLLTPWLASSATHVATYVPTGASANGAHCCVFRPDGTKLYTVRDLSAPESVHQHTLSTPWDLTTATYDTVSFSFASQDIRPTEVAFKPDGTKMWMSGTNNDGIFQYTLSTPWVVSSATHDGASTTINTSTLLSEGTPTGLCFRDPLGNRLYVAGEDGNAIFQVDLS